MRGAPHRPQQRTIAANDAARVASPEVTARQIEIAGPPDFFHTGLTGNVDQLLGQFRRSGFIRVNHKGQFPKWLHN